MVDLVLFSDSQTEYIDFELPRAAKDQLVILVLFLPKSYAFH
jgi:hypothetical protein